MLGEELKVPGLDEPKLLRIGQLAKLTNKTARALHLYEEMDLLCPVGRTTGGFRVYDDSNLSRIRYIDRLQRLGYSLKDIRTLVAEWRTMSNPRDAMASMESIYQARLAEVRRTLADLQGLERELVVSLEFLGGCQGCGAVDTPEQACSNCDRSAETDEDLALIEGLHAH